MKDLEYFKKKVIKILKEKESAESKNVKKSIDNYINSLLHFDTMSSIEKSGYGVGTVRVWRGKKYKKVSQNPTKWVRIYDSVDRGAKSSMTRLINKADSCKSIEELYQFCMSNHAIFKDANGVDLPIMDELRAAVDEKKKRLENGDTSSIRPEKKPAAKNETKKEPASKKSREDFKNEYKNEIKNDKEFYNQIKAEIKQLPVPQIGETLNKYHDAKMREFKAKGIDVTAGPEVDGFVDAIAEVAKEIRDEQKKEESEAEKHQNRSDAMKGNQNAKKDGVAEEEPEKEKSNDVESVKTEIKKVEKLFDEYITGYNHGAGYWLRAKKGDDVHSKAFMRAKGIPYLVKAKEALEAEGYKMPEIPQVLLDKLAEYQKLNAEDTSYFKTAGDKSLSGIKQSMLDDLIEAFKKPLQEKYKELKDKLPKVEDGSPKNNPPVAGKTNEEHAELFDSIRDDSGNTILTYNGKPYAKITGYGSLGDQKKMVQAAGMDSKAQIDYVRNENDWNSYWIGIDSSLKKYGEKKIKELANTPITSDEEFYSKLEAICNESYKDYGYLLRAVSQHEYNKIITEKAKKLAEKYSDNNNAINDIDLPVDPKDMDEAESIIGRKVSAIAGRSDTYGKSLYRAELKKMIESRIRNNPGIARAMLVYIKNYQKENNVVIFTPKNEIWDELPKLNANAMNAVMNGEEETKTGTSGELYSGDDVSSVVEDKDMGRYQITFNGKPDADVRTLLKQNGFRWAPSLGVWQCYNTANGERSLARVAEKLGWKKNS